MHKGKSLKSGVEGVTCNPNTYPSNLNQAQTTYPNPTNFRLTCPTFAPMQPQLSEHQIQASIVAYFNATYPTHRKCLFHVNNKAKDSLEGARFKTLGVVAGVSDLVLLAPNQVYFLELKDNTGKQSDHQKAFQQQAESLHHHYLIIRSLEEFKALLSSINY